MRFVFASVLLFVIFGVALDRLRLGKMHVNLLLRSACTIFVLKSKTRRQIYEIFPVHRTCAQKGAPWVWPMSFPAFRAARSLLYQVFTRSCSIRSAASMPRLSGCCSASVWPSLLAPYQRPLPAARAAGHRRCDLLAGAADDLSADEPPHCYLVVFLRTDRGLRRCSSPDRLRPLGLAGPRRLSPSGPPRRGGSPSQRPPKRLTTGGS